MKTSHILGIALIGAGIYFWMKERNKSKAQAPQAPKEEPKANATGFEVPKSGKKIFTQYGLL